ncbi:MAG: polymer-forming cytoskeletal protein [Candidatus Omnitrophica bacterium]|nr:polymer-forming cytoskeletal protein [Candidatus Omnitrophota bacterium]
MMKRREEEKVLDVNAAMQGSLAFADPVNLRINGKFNGTLNTKGSLIVGESAQVAADIIGENITVSGQVKGKIKATRSLALSSSAEVYADIETPSIAIEAGAIFNGRCTMPNEKMSISELSDFLSIEEAKIVEWVNSGKIPVEREGESLLFDRREVETWISKNY